MSDCTAPFPSVGHISADSISKDAGSAVGNVIIDNLVAGMTVASDVHDRSGRLLLGAGIQLSEKHPRMCRAWGITEVDIVGHGTQKAAEPCEEEVDPLRLQAVEAKLAPLFCNTNLSYPPMAELFRLCLLRKLAHEPN